MKEECKVKAKKKLVILGAFVAIVALVIVVLAEKKAKAAQNQSVVPAN